MNRLILAVLAAVLFASPALADGTSLVKAARAQVGRTIGYDPTYRRIAYPMGDVPIERGVCTDVVIRAFRAIGIDLQQRVHEDMQRNFARYPHSWGLKRPDTNIDHRRVPNLATYLDRQGKAVPVTETATDYRPGDIVTWMLPGNLPHIGIVSDRLHPRSRQPLIIHNIGAGAREEDILFEYKITGHFRWSRG